LAGDALLALAFEIPASHIKDPDRAVAVVNELANQPGIELIVIGGMFRQSELSMVGHVAEQAVREFRADRIFLGMHAIDVDGGFTSDFLPEIMTDRAIMSIGRQVVIVADHSKFGRISSVLVAPVNSADVIVTDTSTPSDCFEKLMELGLHVMIV